MSLYDVLLVDQNATLEEIKLAFKRRALQVHPDKGGSKEEFHLVYQALETLADPSCKKKVRPQLSYWLARRLEQLQQASKVRRRRKREGTRMLSPATSSKAETKTKPQMPGKKSTTFADKAPSSSKPHTGCSYSYASRTAIQTD